MAAQAMQAVVTAAAEGSIGPEEHRKIEELAYRLWLERGRPIGSDQEDWFRAEQMLGAESEEAGQKGGVPA